MPNHTGPVLRVEVRDLRGRKIRRATVTMKSKDGLDRPRKLPFDTDAGAFLLDGFALGSYLLRVTAPRLAAQERHVDLDSGTHREVFILGKKDLPFYYLGTTRVPFEPLANHLGLTLIPASTEDQIDQVAELGRSLGLDSVETGEAIRRNRVLVLRGATEIPDDVMLTLGQHPLVRRVGPLIRLRPDGVTILINEIIAQFKPHVGGEESTDIALRLGLEKVRAIAFVPNGFLLRPKPGTSLDLLDIVHSLAVDDRSVYAEPNLVITPVNHGDPGDFLFKKQWNLPHVQLPEAWDSLADLDPDLEYGSDEIIIAVLDDGIRSTTDVLESSPVHPDFDGKVKPSDLPKVHQFFDFDTMRPGIVDEVTDHGYGVAGIAAALAGNEGIAGVAANCRVIAMRRPQAAALLYFANAYLWAAGLDPGWKLADYVGYDQPVLPALPSPAADVILSGFGTGEPEIGGTLDVAFHRISTEGRNGKGTPIFLSAGNGNVEVNEGNAWAAHPDVITVAASTVVIGSEVKASYSNFGAGVDLCAPSSSLVDGSSDGICTCKVPNSAYGIAGNNNEEGSLDYTNVFGGTSAAVPLVAGVAALILSVNPKLTREAVLQILCDSAVKIGPEESYASGRSDEFGYGRVCALAAVVLAKGTL